MVKSRPPSLAEPGQVQAFRNVILDPVAVPPFLRVDLYAIELHREMDVVATGHSRLPTGAWRASAPCGSEKTVGHRILIHAQLLWDQARPANSRVSVDTLIVSPSLMKSGTRISMPVSSFAGLVTLPLEVSPRTPGSV